MDHLAAFFIGLQESTLPYQVFKRGKEFCVYTLDAKGNPKGASHGCHPTRAQAEAQARAIYANTPNEAGVTMPAKSQTESKSQIDGLYPAPPEILAVVGTLINGYFPALLTSSIAVLVRDKPLDAGTGEDGQPMVTVAAAAVNDDGSLPVDYVIWFALEVWQFLDERQRNAIVFHELKHCGRDAAGKVKLMAHDESVFTQEVELYGAWWKSAQEMLKQMSAQTGKKGTV